MDLLCTGTKDGGDRCGRHRAPGRETCRWHHPEVIESRARALEAQAARVRASAPVAV